ncbi:shikimate dehydrogenase [Desulforhopalus sp. IMCC35007]|uniref:shikimate dehydrogenase n=1 Tax=Desulforhopalus sp. IMCC35007 TaxID=2569543 RepID=UPI0010ADE8A8|nr:shikimate dehydrogenase [Desulforhopalus sp. IMCC35007]TKB12394.1 shikimate dehydrogenase [Desulforhopalus sp. IMCC35007]
MRDLTTKTKLYVLLGNPLGHTISPPMHNLAFEKLSMDCCYFPVEVSAEDLGTVFKGLSKMNVGGLNVTIPHKIGIMDFLDAIDPIAATIGAVNTICMENGKSKGFNTDGEGFIQSLEEEANISVAGKRFFIIGAGGAARAISMTLAFKGAEHIFLYNRTQEKAQSLVSEINEKIRHCAEAVGSEIHFQKEALGSCHILVNSTSIGMHPDIDALPIDPSFLQKELIVADIVYNPRETKLLQVAKEKGCLTVAGLGMLIYQGVAAFKLWTGIEPPVVEMREKVYQLMKEKD